MYFINPLHSACDKTDDANCRLLMVGVCFAYIGVYCANMRRIEHLLLQAFSKL